MKNLRYGVLILGVLLMANAAKAQQTNVKAFVPFDFVVGNRAYSAGEYLLKSSRVSDSIIQIDNLKTPETTTVNVLSNACTSPLPSTETKLVFHRRGGEYFLSQVWIAGNDSGREFPRSQTERKLAQNHENAELVTVAANRSH
jgi:hypothetical protein